jgi:hypothetical protein
MRILLAVAALAAVAVPTTAPAQHIIAQTAGLAAPQHLIDFGANVLPNFTPVSTQFAGITVTHASYFTTGVSNNLVGGFLTNNFGAGLPNTLRIVFANPIKDLTFVYHQISTAQPSVIRAVLGGVTVDSFSGTWNQSQPNNTFGFLNRHFDELQIDFVSDFNVDTLAYNDSTGAALCGMHNGTGVNPPDFTCLALPVLGSMWIGLVNTTPNSVLTFLVYAPLGAAAPTPLFGGELLIDSTSAVAVAGSGIYSMLIPNGPGWLGTVLTFQGFRVDVAGPITSFVPLNANDLLLGL